MNITSNCIQIHLWHLSSKEFPESIEHKANEPVFSFTYFPYPMFNCRRWCVSSLFPRMAVLNSLVFHFWRCFCMQLFDDDCFWILNRQREERRSERRSSMITNNWSEPACLLISFHLIHIQVIHVRYVHAQKRNSTSPDVIFLSFISSARSRDVCCLLM